MLNSSDYKTAIAKIKSMDESEFNEFLSCPEITKEERQLVYDRFGRNKRKWWLDNKTITALAIRNYKSEKTIQRELKRIISILVDYEKIMNEPSKLNPEYELSDWKRAG